MLASASRQAGGRASEGNIGNVSQMLALLMTVCAALFHQDVAHVRVETELPSEFGEAAQQRSNDCAAPAYRILQAGSGSVPIRKHVANLGGDGARSGRAAEKEAKQVHPAQ